MKSTFDRFVGIDWSGAGLVTANTPGLAVAEHSDGITRIVHWQETKRSRAEVVRWIKRNLDPRLPPTLMGLDFSFGFPAGSMALLFGASTWFEMADVIEKLIDGHGTARAVAEFINSRPEFCGQGPFRTNDTRNAFRFHLDSGIPYYRTVENFVPQAISGWYLGSGATVGYSVLTGIAALGQLLKARHDGDCDFRVWPFEQAVPGKHLIAEVYPAIWPKPVPIIKNEHERDAIRIADGLKSLTAESLSLPKFVNSAAIAEEGWILGVY